MRAPAWEVIPSLYIIVLAFLFNVDFSDTYTEPGSTLFSGLGIVSMTTTGVLSFVSFGFITIFSLVGRAVYNRIVGSDEEKMLKALRKENEALNKIKMSEMSEQSTLDAEKKRTLARAGIKELSMGVSV